MANCSLKVSSATGTTARAGGGGRGASAATTSCEPQHPDFRRPQPGADALLRASSPRARPDTASPCAVVHARIRPPLGESRERLDRSAAQAVKQNELVPGRVRGNNLFSVAASAAEQ